ncbi:MAG: restriction endonuclease subunit S, partial [Campylobacter lanienae]|nr:restriction endonuclease subunit S [Campylobacter lanienae]
FYRDKLLNKIDEFEIKNLEDCCNILDNKRKPVTKSSRISGNIPYYGANGIQDYVSEYIFDGRFVLVGEDGSVVNQNGNPIVNWAEGKIWVNNHAHIIEETIVDLRYLYYYIQTINVRELIHGNIPKLNQRDFRKLKIKVPSKEKQKEITDILDRFDKLCNDLSEGLPAEIEARKKQYEYYRDKLLTFKELKK